MKSMKALASGHAGPGAPVTVPAGAPVTVPAGAPVGGWLLILCAWFLVWQPLSAGLVASSFVDRVSIRGVTLALGLTTRVVVTGVGIAAGLAFVARQERAVWIARTSLVLSGATDVVGYTTSIFPNNRPPGDSGWLLVGSLSFYAAWLVYLSRSKRLRG